MAVRKAARTMAGVPAEVIAQLNAGTLQTGNLMEGLVMDLAALARTVIPDLPETSYQTLSRDVTPSYTQRMRLGGRLLLEHVGFKNALGMGQHPSDTVRGWVCYVIGMADRLTIAQRLKHIRPLADDPHSGVREWAWLGIRPQLARNIHTTIELLTPWTMARSSYLRRFAPEATRPRGVWTEHLTILVDQPQLGLPLLEPLRCAAEKYVQDSVANWLNDASKSRPDWVRETCARWERESKHAATKRICTRALRTLEAKPKLKTTLRARARAK